MRAHNFGAGPCTLPLAVLEQIRDQLVDFDGSGMSLVEMSHRSATYDAVHQGTLDALTRVAAVPEDFDVLLVQGGATLQFAMVPMNLLGPEDRAGYVVSGSWGSAALDDARLVGDVSVVWDGADSDFTTMPGRDDLMDTDGMRYVHVTSNETIGGVRLVELPATDCPLVADMSSDFLTRPIEWDRFDLVYGGVQKNLAPSGLAVVFLRRGAVSDQAGGLPKYLRYEWHAESGSLGNTPAMFPIWVMGEVLRRMEESGGVEGLERRTHAKAQRLYDVIDASDGFYSNPVDELVRSHTNVVFRLHDTDAETAFLAEADRRNMIGLKGHRSVGGIRASLYAALEMESVEALAGMMEEFAASR